MGAQPLVPDPYEARTVAVRRSGLGAGEGGEGLFVTRDIARGEVVAFYNGVTSPRLHIVRLLSKYLCVDKTASEVWSQRMLGQLCIQNIHQHQRGPRRAAGPARGAGPAGALLRHARPQDQPQLPLQLHRVVLPAPAPRPHPLRGRHPTHPRRRRARPPLRIRSPQLPRLVRGRAISVLYLHTIYTLSTHYLHTNYTISTHYLHTRYAAELATFMRDNPELELEQAADPGRLVRTKWGS